MHKKKISFLLSLLMLIQVLSPVFSVNAAISPGSSNELASYSDDEYEYFNIGDAVEEPQTMGLFSFRTLGLNSPVRGTDTVVYHTEIQSRGLNGGLFNWNSVMPEGTVVEAVMRDGNNKIQVINDSTGNPVEFTLKNGELYDTNDAPIKSFEIDKMLVEQRLTSVFLRLKTNPAVDFKVIASPQNATDFGGAPNDGKTHMTLVLQINQIANTEIKYVFKDVLGKTYDGNELDVIKQQLNNKSVVLKDMNADGTISFTNGSRGTPIDLRSKSQILKSRISRRYIEGLKNPKAPTLTIDGKTSNNELLENANTKTKVGFSSRYDATEGGLVTFVIRPLVVEKNPALNFTST